MKYCGTCGNDKDESEFNKNKSKKDGLGSICRVCSNKRSKEDYVKNPTYYKLKAKERRIQERIYFYTWLQTKKCVDCGNTDFRVLEFDHVRGEKSYNISSKIAVFNLETLLKEIEKCDIVCANCHKIRHAERDNHYDYLK